MRHFVVFQVTMRFFVEKPHKAFLIHLANHKLARQSVSGTHLVFVVAWMPKESKFYTSSLNFVII